MMRGINYERAAKALLSADVYHMLVDIHEYKGEHRAYIANSTDILHDFYSASKIHSIEASCRMCGEFIPEYRITQIYEGSVKLQDFKDRLASGYRDIMEIAENNHSKILIQRDFVERMYFEMQKYRDASKEKLYRTDMDNSLNLYSNALRKQSLSMPELELSRLGEMLDKICAEYTRESAIEEFDNLLIIPLFILDFICIGPFREYNFVFAIQLLQLLLYREGYMIGRYISLEKDISESLDECILAIAQSSRQWEKGENSYLSFVKYCLSTIKGAYEEFFDRLELAKNKGISKPEKVRLILRDTDKPTLSKRDIRRLCPDISVSTVEHTLNELLKNNVIKKVGGGRSTGYVYIGEEK